MDIALHKQTISTSTLHTLFLAAESVGIKRDYLLKECGINSEIFSSPDNRFALSGLDCLISKVVEISGDHCFGLRMGKYFTFTGNVVLYMMLNCANYEEVCHKYFKYQKIISEARHIDFKIEKEMVKFTVQMLAKQFVHKRHMLDKTVSSIVYGTKQVVMGDFNFERIEFTHNQPELYAEYEKYFDCQLLWGRPVTTIWFDKKYLKAPIRQPNAELKSVLQTYADQLLLKLNNQETYSKKVLKIMSDFAFDFTSTVDEVAAKIPTSSRNLQMKLKSENTSYQKLREDTRREKSLMLLESGASIAEISYILGFSEPSVFQRAFKKWTGQPPGEYRKQFSA